mmetsp:Transcript_18679/g.47188  ORF Transcript_18679/g.47188 Transcript_18679/m.47188 type:complete len:406 (+) Transcript_18679:1-1218(+)
MTAYSDGGYMPSWRPTAQRALDIGSTDLKAARDPVARGASFDTPNQKYTMNQRSTQPVINHWTRVKQDGTTKPDPDINRSRDYAENKYRAYNDSVAIGQAVPHQTIPGVVQVASATQNLVDEFEQRRTRGIPGYTGKQPQPFQRRPEKAEEAGDPSKLYGRGGSSVRKPWSRGIAGYTGHQPAQEYLRSGSELERHGVYLTIDLNSKAGRHEYNLAPDRDMDDETMSSPISNHSSSSQKVFKNNMVVGNAPEDIARRKIEEALQYGDPMIEHEGSVATLRLSTKYHKAPPREQEGNLPKPPVDHPKPGPLAEGKGAWKTTKGDALHAPAAECDFDWFMSEPKPVDKRPVASKPSTHWNTISEMIEHNGPHAGRPRVPYEAVAQRGRPVAYGGVKNSVRTYIAKQL